MNKNNHVFLSVLAVVLIILIVILLCLVYYYHRHIYFAEHFMEFPDLNLNNIGMGTTSNDSDKTTDEESMMRDYMGHNYSFIKNVKTPKALGVSSSPNMMTIPTNVDAITKYTGYLSKEPEMGSNYFVKSGYCDTELSVDECKGKEKWMYVRNIPTGIIPCTNIKTGSKGLISGILEDINDINPFEIAMNTMGNGSAVSRKCVLRTEKVGTKKKYEKHTRCAPKTKPVSCMPEF